MVKIGKSIQIQCFHVRFTKFQLVPLRLLPIGSFYRCFMLRVIKLGRISKFVRFNQVSPQEFDVQMSAFYIANKIDLDHTKEIFLQNKQFSNIIKTSSSLFLQFKNDETNQDAPSFVEEFPDLKFKNRESNEKEIVSSPNDSFMVIYKYGSITFVNVDDVKQREITNSLKVSHSTQIHDDLVINVDHNIKAWFKYKKDELHLQLLNMNNINIISSVLARSVALRNREKQVDVVLSQFKKLNEIIINTNGHISKAEEKALIPVIAQSNALQMDVLLNLKLFEQPDLVWNVSQYADMFERLNEDFEIDDRYKLMTEKLEFISNSSKFYMETRHSRKSEYAEILIIILIMTEVLIAILNKH
jgi:uncharacterized Rmd1/YagE family protein